MRELNVALIGGGGFMGKAHSLAYALAPVLDDLGAVLVKHTLVDATPELASAAAQRLGWQNSSADWEAVVRDPSIDIIDIVTPPQFHEPIASAAIAAGKAVFCEKPITNDAASAQALADRADEAGVTNQVGFNYRHTPALTYVKELLDEGRLGTPLQFRASYLQDAPYFFDNMGWRASKATGGSGATGDIGSHVIDLAQYLNGPITRVTARLRSSALVPRQPWMSEEDREAADLNDDAGVWLAEFESGAIGTFAINLSSYGRKNQIRFEMDLTHGSVEYDWNRREEVRLGFADDAQRESGLRTVIVGDAHSDIWYPVPGIGLGYVEGSAIQIKRFVAALLDGGRAHPDFQEAAQVERIVEAIHESARTGEWVDVRQPVATS